MENSLETQAVINYIQGRMNLSPPSRKYLIDIDEDILSEKLGFKMNEVRLIMENLLNSNYERENLVSLTFYDDKNNKKCFLTKEYNSTFFKLDVGKKYTLEINQKVWGRRIYFDQKSGYLWFNGKKIYFQPSRQREFLKHVCTSEGSSKGIEIDFLKKKVCNKEFNMEELLRSLVKEIGKKVREEWKIHNPFSFKDGKVFFIPVSEKSLKVFSAF